MFLLGECAATVRGGKADVDGSLLLRERHWQSFAKWWNCKEEMPGWSTIRHACREAQHSLEVESPRSGYVTAIQCEQAGTACVILGGGRERKEDSVDPAVGFVLHKKVGDAVSTGDSLCTVHYNSETRGERARKLLQGSFQIGDAPPTEQTATGSSSDHEVRETR